MHVQPVTTAGLAIIKFVLYVNNKSFAASPKVHNSVSYLIGFFYNMTACVSNSGCLCSVICAHFSHGETFCDPKAAKHHSLKNKLYQSINKTYYEDFTNVFIAELALSPTPQPFTIQKFKSLPRITFSRESHFVGINVSFACYTNDVHKGIFMKVSVF